MAPPGHTTGTGNAPQNFGTVGQAPPTGGTGPSAPPGYGADSSAFGTGAAPPGTTFGGPPPGASAGAVPGHAWNAYPWIMPATGVLAAPVALTEEQERRRREREAYESSQEYLDTLQPTPYTLPPIANTSSEYFPSVYEKAALIANERRNASFDSERPRRDSDA